MKMYYRKEKILVEVYNFFEDGRALIYSPSFAGKNNGMGWEKVKVSQLIPEEYVNEYNKNFMSKTKRNKIKKRLTLTYSEWTCTDGSIFDNCDEAIAYEEELMEKEVNNA